VVGGGIAGAFAGGTLGLGPVASAGVLGAGGIVGGAIGDAIAGEPASACRMAVTGAATALTGGLGAKLFPLQGVHTRKQIAYFAPALPSRRPAARAGR
jgi:hypothetical protein